MQVRPMTDNETGMTQMLSLRHVMCITSHMTHHVMSFDS